MALITGVDVGGTFTDVVVLDEAAGEVRVAKVSSTPQDQSLGFLAGLEATGHRPADLDLVVHGTTVATNAILERKGARCALITTRGFRDVLEMRRRDRPRTWGLRGEYQPLIPRDRRYEVSERTDARGTILRPLDPAEVEAVIRRILASGEGIEAVVVCFLHAYANPAHERLARDVIARLWPNDYIALSSEVMPEYREFERTSTAAVSAYVRPVIDRYLRNLQGRLRQRGHARDLLLIQSNGGLMSLTTARTLAANTVLSGPAAGVIAATAIARAAGFPNAITCDMGGTSLDICLVAGGTPALTSEARIDFGIPIRTPMIEINTIGAGGGSIAWLDAGGFLRTGPQSAGADPGPACYGKGGAEPTITDANLLLGRIDERHPISTLPGGRFDVEAARRAVEGRVGRALGLDATRAADAILRLANVGMAGALRLVSIERGHDPREFVLVAFGGAGPLHAGALMHEVGIGRALIPPYPGITSALGCIMADARYDFVHTLNRRLAATDPAVLERIAGEQIAHGRRLVESAGLAVAEVLASLEADMAYEGQVHPVRTPLGLPPLTQAGIASAFEAAYRRQYGRTLEGVPVRIVSLRSSVVGVRPRLDLSRMATRGAETLANARTGCRPVWFTDRFAETPIYSRPRLPRGAALPGPAIVEQADTTTVIERGMVARVDPLGNLIVEDG